MTRNRRQSYLLMASQLIFLSLLFTLHYLVGEIRSGGDYSPFSTAPSTSPLIYDETQQYLPGARHFMRTGNLHPEVDVREMGELSNGFPVMHALLLGTAGKVLGNLELAWMLAHAVFPGILWLLFFFLFGYFTSNLWLRSAWSWATILFAFSPRSSLLLGNLSLIQPLEVSRLPHPALSFCFLLLALFGVTAALEEGEKKKIVLGGILSGILFYTYYYYFVGWFGGLGLCFLGALALGETAIAKRLVGVILIGLLTGLPYFFRLYTAAVTGSQRALLYRVGGFNREVTVKTLLIGFACLLSYGFFHWWQRKKEKNQNYSRARLSLLLSFGLLAGGGVGLNLHLLTGYNPQHGHFINRVIEPLAFFLGVALLALISFRSGGFRVWFRRASFGFAGVLVLIAGYRQYECGLAGVSGQRLSTSRAKLSGWIREHIPVDKVIGTTDPELVMLLPGIAGNWTFMPMATRSMADGVEDMKRYFILAQLESVDLEQAKAQLLKPAPDGDHLWLMPEYVFFGAQGPDQGVVQLAESTWAKENAADLLQVRKLDYLALSPSASLIPAKRLFSNLEIVYSNSEWRLIKLGPLLSPDRQIGSTRN